MYLIKFYIASKIRSNAIVMALKCIILYVLHFINTKIYKAGKNNKFAYLANFTKN